MHVISYTQMYMLVCKVHTWPWRLRATHPFRVGSLQDIALQLRHPGLDHPHALVPHLVSLLLR
jgi:hypothetical protein